MQSSTVITPLLTIFTRRGLGGLYEVAGLPFSEVLFDSKNSNSQFSTAIAFAPGTQPFTAFSGANGGRLAYQADFGFESQDWFVTILTPAELGDYNADGVVNGGDYLVWRSAYGTTDAMADGNLNGVVDAADYVIWRDHANAVGAVAASLSRPQNPVAFCRLACAL